MSTQSPNFNLVIATTSDTVDVVAQISNNFSTLDTLFAVAHTGTGQLRSGLFLATPSLSNPSITGAVTGVFSLVASTGQFNTITATGGALKINTLTVGTYGFPAVAGTDSTILIFQTGNLVVASQSPNTGANLALSNLASIAINTNLNTFTAGLVTVDRIIASSGSLTGLTSFQATTGTFAGLLTALGTITANVINCTGGMGTFSNVTVGTWALPSTLGPTNSIIRSLSNTATYYTPVTILQTAFSVYAATGITISQTGTDPIGFTSESYDLGGNVSAGVFTAPTNGIYEFSYNIIINRAASTAGRLASGIVISTTAYELVVNTASGINPYIPVGGYFVGSVASGATVFVYTTGFGIGGGGALVNANAGSFIGKRLYEL